ncbi:MAG TPA: methyltransferase family protein [Candidatus Wunengus sp. YC63]|uniref:methyltransferase family protein n=1 Tax=Candidatus Wunengus sp. YC63 TaxID=3367699 RepID=UPI0040254668
MGHFITYFSAIFFVAYMTIAFVYPSVRTYRETGVNPITFGKEDNAHDFIGKWFKIILGLIPVVIVCNSVGEGAYQWLLPARYLEIPEMQFTGVVLCILSLIWTAIAQYHMGTAWRIGIDNKHKTGLVTFGLFKLSRNPIFLGMLFT